ncbi:MAG TPA: class I SAM-dependent methyltransferase [Nocardioides sp.]|uniref:class I SAM-dependent methyltransferase n=1 Tax=Nocardioides sp. TaxID=35761 RepID=UPI002BC9C0D3|nr:class I SAM-dependent methyltransferase [Nocardioides sp.]HQR25764.1 class I SAM-dependent methyltransferase [Nocardioides sp.]
MTTITVDTADQLLKERHRAMWALGDYPAVAREIIPALGPVLVRAAAVRPGQRVLDVAAGSGNVALPAARAGAEVLATDLTPDLLAHGQREAAAEGLEIAWREADAEALPCEDGEYDAVLSCVGVMFAPHHQASADELVRVCRPGGTIGLVSWTPEGFIGQLFATMRPYVPAPPAGVQPPPLWGDPDHVRGLLGDRVSSVTAQRQRLLVDRFADGAEFRDYFKSHYGPTVAAYRAIADDPERSAALDRDLAALGDAHDLGGGAMEWEYLLLTATRR